MKYIPVWPLILVEKIKTEDTKIIQTPDIANNDYIRVKIVSVKPFKDAKVSLNEGDIVYVEESQLTKFTPLPDTFLVDTNTNMVIENE